MRNIVKFLAAILIINTISIQTFADYNGTEIIIYSLSNDFLEYINDTEAYEGIVPSPVSFETENNISIVGTSEIPSSYDGRDSEILPPVRNQGTDGNCWSFASIGSLETTVSAKLGINDIDYSEQHMVQSLGNNPNDDWTFDYNMNDGGNYTMAAAYFARWSGPVFEKDVPYGTILDDVRIPAKSHVQNIQFVPQPTNKFFLTADYSYRQKIQKKIMEFGSIYTAYAHIDEAYNESTFGYYNNNSDKSTHAVTLVGWDDKYDASNFIDMPEGNGAWIARNSWSETFGDNGYFYISYYDKLIGSDATVYPDVEETTNYHNIYQYDPLGLSGNMGYKTTKCWMSNKFEKTPGNQAISAVSFYAIGENTTYYIYADPNAQEEDVKDFADEEYLAVQTFKEPGYYTIDLPEPVKITGSHFTVAVKISAVTDARVPVEMPIEKFSAKAEAQANQSFIRYEHYPWTDVTTAAPNANICLKAFTTEAPEFEYEMSATKKDANTITVSFTKNKDIQETHAYIFVTSGDNITACKHIQVIKVSLSDDGQPIDFNIPQGMTVANAFLFSAADGMTPLANDTDKIELN